MLKVEKLLNKEISVLKKLRNDQKYLNELKKIMYIQNSKEVSELNNLEEKVTNCIQRKFSQMEAKLAGLEEKLNLILEKLEKQ